MAGAESSADAAGSAAIGLDNGFPNGQLRIYGLIGDPVSQVRAPFPMTQKMRENRLNAALIPLHVPVDVLPTVFAGLKLIRNFDGLVVTVPHKISMAGLVDRISERALLVGAINVARREADDSWSGDILDGVGFVRGLIDRGFDPKDQNAFVVGAGGAGCAVAVELALAGASVRVFDPLPVDPTLLSAEMLVAEVVMKPPVTAFLDHARARGCQTQLGEAVMLHQLDDQVEFFRGSLA